VLKRIYSKIYREIRKYDTIVIVRHVGPDPDALGAQIGLKEIILNTFPKKKVYAVGTPTLKFKFMGKLDRMKEEYYNNALVIVLDTPDKKRVDGVEISKFKQSVKIDHHPFLEEFCNIEWIDSSASSAAQLIIELCFNSRLKMTKSAAEKLFIGVVADTDRFLFDYTTTKTFDLVKRLINKMKININELYTKLYTRTLNEIRLQGYIAQNMIITESGVGYIILTDDIIKEFKVDAASAGNLVNNFNYIDEVLIWLTISEDVKQNTFRVNIRSRGPVINEAAEEFNGGGHKYASGARLSSLEDASMIVARLDEISKLYKDSK
jgi:bifunctional oligoribonuclease and PAP phosphatase NrnA